MTMGQDGDGLGLLVEVEPREHHYFSVPVAAAQGSHAVMTSGVYLVGWSLRESTGSAAAVAEFYNGEGSGAELVGEVSLASGTSNTQRLGDHGIRCHRGLFINMTSGTVLGAVWVRS